MAQPLLSLLPLLPLLPLLLQRLVSAQELDLRTVVRRDYDTAKVSGVWYSISMASDDMKRIEENGDLRVFIQTIESLDNGSLKLSFHFMLHGGCVEVAMVCEKTDKNGEYTLAYKGDGKVLLLETDYRIYAIFYLHSVSNSTETQVLALFGRIAELGPSFLAQFEKICRRYRLGPQNIIDLSSQDLCLKYKR